LKVGRIVVLEVQILNQELKERLAKKISESEFSATDLPDFLTAFCEISNEAEDIQSETQGWTTNVQLDITDADKFWLRATDGTFTSGTGSIDAPDATLRTSGEIAARVFAGEKDATAAYMEGSLKVDGKLSEALKLRTIIGLVLEKLQE
jgi:putative sterol carrier protein